MNTDRLDFCVDHHQKTIAQDFLVVLEPTKVITMRNQRYSFEEWQNSSLSAFLETKIIGGRYSFSKPEEQLIETAAGHLFVTVDLRSFGSASGYVRERPHVFPSNTSV